MPHTRVDRAAYVNYAHYAYLGSTYFSFLAAYVSPTSHLRYEP